MNFVKYYSKINPEIRRYYNILCHDFPSFLIPFIETKTMDRLKDVSYFCGAYHGSTKIYNFKYDISRLEHSISTALITWNFTYNPEMTISALYHDATTPAFSHVIDYLNKDYITQESTELPLLDYLNQNDQDLLKLFEKYGINPSKIASFKDYSIVDLPRPKLCADRLDCIFLANLTWSKLIELEDIVRIYNDVCVLKNEDNEEELSFMSLASAEEAVNYNNAINNMTQTKGDFNSMQILSDLVRRLIDTHIINYEDLFILTDKDLFKIIEANLNDSIIKYTYFDFKTLSHDLDKTNFKIKNRSLNPYVLTKRYSKY